MEGSNGNSNSPAPFLLKTYEMVDNPLTDAIVSWSVSGHSFVVWNPPEFATELLPKYFKHNNFSSFIRQLNTYGFRKADPELWEFSNEDFVKDQKHLLRSIHRRKPVHSHSVQPIPAPLNDPERDEFLTTIKRLKQEKHSLQSELERHRHENREYECQLRSLGQTLHNINRRQRQLVEGLAGLMLPENPSKRRRLLALSHLRDETHEPSTGLPVEEDIFKKLESSLNFWDELVRKIPVPAHPDSNSFLEDCDADNSNEHRVGLACESPPISSICIDLEPMGKSGSNRTEEGRGIVSGAARPAAGAGPGANDVFWQQFLTEVPDAERNSDDDDRKKGDGISGGLAEYKYEQLWWVNVDHKPNLPMM